MWFIAQPYKQNSNSNKVQIENRNKQLGLRSSYIWEFLVFALFPEIIVWNNLLAVFWGFFMFFAAEMIMKVNFSSGCVWTLRKVALKSVFPANLTRMVLQVLGILLCYEFQDIPLAYIPFRSLEAEISKTNCKYDWLTIWTKIP